MNETVYLLYSCNEWKEYRSFRLIGVARDWEMLCLMLGSQILAGDIYYRGMEETDSWRLFLRDYQAGQVDPDCLTYAHVEYQTAYGVFSRKMEEDFRNICSARKKMQKIRCNDLQL